VVFFFLGVGISRIYARGPWCRISGAVSMMSFLAGNEGRCLTRYGEAAQGGAAQSVAPPGPTQDIVHPSMRPTANTLAMLRKLKKSLF
jgi:hypothetical protein